jgi:hypothetical protein
VQQAQHYSRRKRELPPGNAAKMSLVQLKNAKDQASLPGMKRIPEGSLSSVNVRFWLYVSRGTPFLLHLRQI